jgi:hypothetical protein
MAYPTISYNTSTGSTTNPSDCVASSVGTSVTAGGTASGTTITFDFTDSELTSLDLSSCADDGSDYIWTDTDNNADDRTLFQITAFSPSKAACTSITVEQVIDSTFSAAAWHINGTRQYIGYQVSGNNRMDFRNWCRGWTAELDGTFTLSAAVSFWVAENDSATNAKDDPTLTVKASPSASTRPKVQTTQNADLLAMRDAAPLKVIGIDLEHIGTGNASFGAVLAYSGPITLIDCTVENNSTIQPTNGVVRVSGFGTAFRAYNCYIKGGANYVVGQTANGGDGLILDNCWLDCQDTYGTTAAVLFRSEGAMLLNTLITDAAGVGVLIDDSSNIQRDALRTIKNCTITGCGGDGVTYTGSGSGSDSNATQMTTILNTLITDCTGYAVDLDGFSLPPDPGYIDYNCMFNNSLGSYNGVDAGPNDVTITTTPFTDAANDDYSLNNTATGGALLRDAALYDLPTEP